MFGCIVIILGVGFVIGMYFVTQIETHIEKRIKPKRDKYFLKDNIDGKRKKKETD